MIDTRKFAKRFTSSLLNVAAEHRGVGNLEALRRYQTDPNFHAQIDALVGLAVQILNTLDVDEAVEPYEAPFWDEVNSLLGWKD